MHFAQNVTSSLTNSSYVTTSKIVPEDLVKSAIDNTMVAATPMKGE
jgi:hypothetical protein